MGDFCFFPSNKLFVDVLSADGDECMVDWYRALRSTGNDKALPPCLVAGPAHQNRLTLKLRARIQSSYLSRALCDPSSFIFSYSSFFILPSRTKPAYLSLLYWTDREM
jgi:hypothetical protein